MNCAYCDKEFRRYNSRHKFCSKNCKENFRWHKNKDARSVKEQKAREFVDEMLSLNGSVFSIKLNEVKE